MLNTKQGENKMTKIEITKNKHGVCRTEKDPKYPRVFVDLGGLGFTDYDVDLDLKGTPEFEIRSQIDTVLRRHKGRIAPVDDVAKQAIEHIGLPKNTKYYWDDYAGCDMCPCSGGVVIEHEHEHDYRAKVDDFEGQKEMIEKQHMAIKKEMQ